MSELEIIQDYDCDDIGELGMPIDVFWAEGHGHSVDQFVRALIDYCLDEGVDIPRIPQDIALAEMWQRNIAAEGAVIFDRTPDSPEYRDAFPVTVLDLETRRRGGTKCGVDKCGKPWSSGVPVSVRVEPGDLPYMAVRMWFCREHAKHLPGPSYRVCLVPVGAEIVLPSVSVGGAS